MTSGLIRLGRSMATRSGVAHQKGTPLSRQVSGGMACCTPHATLSKESPQTAIFDPTTGQEEPDGGIKKILSNNEAWSAKKLAEEPDYFKNRSSYQKPHFLYLGCSDSRVPAESLMGLEPGDLFVHRNIANQALNWDTSVEAILEFGVGVLGVSHILVCGHTNCGGVHASMKKLEGSRISNLNTWLHGLRDINRNYASFLSSIQDESDRFLALTELNVAEQCINIAVTEVVSACRRERAGLPHIHALIYDICNGRVRPISPDIRDRVVAHRSEQVGHIFSVDASSIFSNQENSKL